MIVCYVSKWLVEKTNQPWTKNSPVCLVFGGHFQLRYVSIPVFCPCWRCVSPPHPLSPHTPPSPPSLLKKPSVIAAPVFYTLPFNWCLINLWQPEVSTALVLTNSLTSQTRGGNPGLSLKHIKTFFKKPLKGVCGNG